MTEPQPPYNPQPDPFAPVDYPADNPGPAGYPPLPPPVYPNAQGYPPPGYPPPPGWPQQPYAPGYYDPYNYYAAPTGVPPGTNGKAIAALVCGGLGLVLCMCFVPSVLAIILGVLGLTDTKRTGQAGSGLAIGGIVLGAVTLLLGIFFLSVGALDFH